VVIGFRQHISIALRPVVAAFLIFAVLLPSLVQALPKPTLTPEQELLRDIATSICSGSGNKEDGDRKGHDDQDCQHCILCAVSSFALAGLDSNSSSGLQLGAVPASIFGERWSAPRLHPLSRETGPPRAPPLIS
jgi:hypothetical protein